MDATGCTVDGGPVNIIEPGLIVINADVVNISCHGDNDGSISISASNGTGSFTYSIDGGLTYVDNGGSFTGLGPSTYEVSVMDSVECIANGTAVEITDPEILVIDTTGVVHISNENTSGTITLESTGGTPPVVFVIVPDSVASYTGQFTGLDTGTYRLFAVDTNNCRSNELNITILNVGTNGNMLILYDAFSPFTTPGQNDVWNIGNIRLYPNCTVKIFNTWGRMVFSSNGYAEPWDGRYNNKELPSGTYYYVIDPGDGSAEISGPVNIVY
jgi:gliding motility-associated-like protein